MSDGRPKTNQPSRKGRKAWRKNVDIIDIEQKLKDQQEELINHGKLISEVDEKDLFFIDEDPDEKTLNRFKNKNVKKLKSSEILTNKSKISKLTNEKIKFKNSKKLVEGISKKEIHQLMKLAGKIKGADKVASRIEKDGIISSKNYDVWNTVSEEEIKRDQLPEILKKYSSISYTPATVKPETLSKSPIKIRNLEKTPHAGKSYNPSFDNWKHLIEQEYFKEKSKEDQRLELEDAKERIQFLINNYKDNELADDSDEEEERKEEDAAVEDEAEEIDDEIRLSVNPAVENKLKSQAQRNKEKKYKERLRLEKELKELKLRIKELDKLPEILKEANEKELEKSLKPKINKDNLKISKETKKLGSKFTVIDGPLEVKLSNELSDSLRKLKPEGNLLYDQMRLLQSQGKIETRRINKQKKAKTRVTEKWSYKDFKW